MLAPLDLSNSCKKIKHSQHGFTAPLASSPTILHTALASSTPLSSSTIYLLPRPSICHPSLLHATVLLDSSNFGCERDISRDHLFPLPTPLLPPQSCPLPLHLVNDVRRISQRQHFIARRIGKPAPRSGVTDDAVAPLHGVIDSGVAPLFVCEVASNYEIGEAATVLASSNVGGKQAVSGEVADGGGGMAK